jgi:hypothetical protein
MNKPKATYLIFSSLMAAMTMVSSHAEANAASFNSYATVTYTITSLTNNTNAGDFSNLSIFANYEQDILSGYLAIAGGGNHAITQGGSNDFTELLPQVGASVSKTFAINAATGNGTLESLDFAFFSLDLFNLSADHYSVGVQLDYELSANASGGDLAESSAQIDWFISDDSDSGFYYATSAALADGVNGPIQLTLDLNGETALSVSSDLAISGNLAASPVPLPPAAWSFMLGLLALVRSNRARMANI